MAAQTLPVVVLEHKEQLLYRSVVISNTTVHYLLNIHPILFILLGLKLLSKLFFLLEALCLMT